MEINFWQVLFQFINFGVVFAAITFLMTKPIMKILDDRRTKAEEAAKAAEETVRAKEEIEGMKKRVKTQADKDAAKVLDAARDDAKALKAKLTKEVKDEVGTLRAKELEKLEAETGAKRKQMEEDVTKLSVAIASKVLGKEIDAKGHKTLVSQAIKELGTV